MALGIAVASAAFTAPAKPAKFDTVYWFYVTNTIAENQPNTSALVNPSATPFVGSESTIRPDCGGTDLYCAKGFTPAEVDATTHQPAAANSPSTYRNLKD